MFSPFERFIRRAIASQREGNLLAVPLCHLCLQEVSVVQTGAWIVKTDFLGDLISSSPMQLVLQLSQTSF